MHLFEGIPQLLRVMRQPVARAHCIGDEETREAEDRIFKRSFSSPWHPERGSTRRPMRLNLTLKAAQICWALTAQPKSVFAGAVYGLPLVAKLHASDPQTLRHEHSTGLFCVRAWLAALHREQLSVVPP